MIGPGVAIVDPEGEQLGLHHVGSAAVPGRVDAAVVGEQCRGQPPACAGFLEGPQHSGSRRGAKNMRSHRQPRVIVDEVHDLHLGVIAQSPVREVGLPALVRELGFEPDPRAPRSFVRLGGHEAPSPEHPPDRRDRRHLLVVKPQVVVDRLGAGIQAEIAELLAERHDLVLDPLRGAVGDPLRSPRPWLERAVATLAEAPDELPDVALGDPMGRSHLPVGAALEHHGVHHVASQIHRRPPSSVSTMLRHICPLSGELADSPAHQSIRPAVGPSDRPTD